MLAAHDRERVGLVRAEVEPGLGVPDGRPGSLVPPGLMPGGRRQRHEHPPGRRAALPSRMRPPRSRPAPGLAATARRPRRRAGAPRARPTGRAPPPGRGPPSRGHGPRRRRAGRAAAARPRSARPRAVPVTTTPRPRTSNVRSIARRAGPPPVTSPGAGWAAIAASVVARSAMPEPVVAETGTTGMSRSVVAEMRPRTSPTTSSTRSGDTRSAFVIAATPSRSASASSSARCSSVCARGPSSAATTSRQASISPAPTSMLPTSRSWPGTSTKSSRSPAVVTRWAYPTSIVRPRRFSSGSRSASMPVSARRSVVLPWSM